MTAKRYLRYLPVLGVVTILVIVVGLVYLFMNFLNNKPPQTPVRVQQISLLPPLPPPKLEKPPEPEIKEVPMVDAPKDSSDDTPPGNELGLDANGNGADNFGLKAAKGGRGLLDGGPFGHYSAALKADIRDWISQNKKLRHSNYFVELKLWIAHSGRIERVELASSTGNAEIDQRLQTMIVSFVGKTREPPPQEMPQPVRLGVRAQS